MKFVMKLTYRLSIFFAFILLISNLAFAQTEREKGIKLYQEGRTKEAVAVLEKASKEAKNDAETWNALALAYLKDNEAKKAVKAFEKAVALSPQNAAFHANLAYAYWQNNKPNKAQEESGKAIAIDPKNTLAYYVRGAANVYEGDNDEAISDADSAIKTNPDYSPAYILKSDAMLYKFGRSVGSGSKPIDEVETLRQAKEVLETCLKNCRNNTQVELQQERLKTLGVFYNYFNKNRDFVLSPETTALTLSTAPTLPDPTVTPVKILSKPPPHYTDSARQNNIVGTITMAVYFAETGRVTYTLILKGLGGGLNENARRAALGIKFEPATKDGKPIAVIKMVTYSFSIY